MPSAPIEPIVLVVKEYAVELNNDGTYKICLLKSLENNPIQHGKILMSNVLHSPALRLSSIAKELIAIYERNA